MELYAGAVLNGVGYALNKDRDTLKKTETGVNPRQLPSMQNVYKSKYYDTTRADEFDRATIKWQESQSPFETGVVPKPAYADMFASPFCDNQIINSPMAVPQVANKAKIRTLAGKEVEPEQFFHNNMQPYIRGAVKQNTDTFANQTLLNNYTGRGDTIQHKKEVECFFEPTSQYGNACGFMSNPNDYERQHIFNPKARKNDFPIQQIHVGPGLGLGYTTEGAGGYQQANTVDFIMPKNVDQLRVGTNPRIEYKLPVPATGQGVGRRGIMGEFAKNKPDTYFEQSPDMWLKTTGAQMKASMQPKQEMKPTSRVDTHIAYQGPTQASGNMPGIGAEDDYGLDSVLVYDNNRQDTGQDSILNNLKSTVNAVIAPLLDFFRHNPKEYTLDASRVYGNLQAQIPDKATLYDPVNHIIKTTNKETLIHDTNISNLKGPDKITAAVMDTQKPTVRETTPIVDTTRQMTSHTYRVQLYNVDEVARTTVRETTDQSPDMLGFISGVVTDSTGAYSVIDVDMRNTNRQFSNDYEYEGIAGSKSDFRETSQDAERNADIDATKDTLNRAAGNTPNGAGAFTSLAPEKIDMQTKKLNSDSLSEREVGNITRIAQSSEMDNGTCAITKIGNNYLNANVDRLDPVTLNSLKSNPYSLSINPIGV